MSLTTATSIPIIADDRYAGEMPEALDPQVIRDLSRITPWISTVHIAWEWTLILGTAWLGWHFWNPWMYLPLVMFIGARQHALIILMHDGAHYRLARSHRLNDWISELMLTWPFALFTMRAYRRNHWPHHRHTNGEGDPDWARKQTSDWAFPKSKFQLFRLLVLDLLGIGFVRFLVTTRKLPSEDSLDAGNRRGFTLARLGYLATAAVLLTVFELWMPFVLFWLVPFITWMQFAFHVRSIAEHFAMPELDGAFGQTRTTIATPLEQVFLIPKNVGYHLEHHLYPSVPFYNLPALHERLRQQPAYDSMAHVTHGYWRVLRECVAPNSPGEQHQESGA